MYNSPELDTLITTIGGEQDAAARQAAYADLWRYLDENAAIAPLVYSQRIYALSKQVSGFDLAGTEYELALQFDDCRLGLSGAGHPTTGARMGRHVG